MGFLGAILAQTVLAALVPWPNETCKSVNVSALTYCKNTIAATAGRLIPASWDEEEADIAAHQGVFDLRACPAFDIQFQCAVYFPRCDNRSGETYVVGMCRETCLRAKRYEGAFCDSLDIDAICSNSQYFDPLPDCDDFAVATNQPSETWKIILGAVLGSLGFIVLLSLCIGFVRAKLYKPEFDTNLDFEDERKEAQRVKKIQEKAARQGEDYVDVEAATATPTTRSQWTSAQEARDAAVARQRIASETEMTGVQDGGATRESS